jgi:hypothetical protein
MQKYLGWLRISIVPVRTIFTPILKNREASKVSCKEQTNDSAKNKSWWWIQSSKEQKAGSWKKQSLDLNSGKKYRGKWQALI